MNVCYNEVQEAQNLETRIVGGSATIIEKFPYQVSIIYIDSHFCGGSLIHPQFVLTAAHCTLNYPPKLLLVRAGSTYIDQGGQVRQVIRVYIHPKYDSKPIDHDNDISVLTLENPFKIGANIKPISLPVQDESIEDNQIGVATGWGHLSHNGVIPLELQHVRLPTINRTNCKKYNDGVTRNMFCARSVTGGKDTCQGDSGGPFVVNGVVVGITSWGYECASKTHLGVYTQVSRYTKFITAIINN